MQTTEEMIEQYNAFAGKRHQEKVLRRLYMRRDKCQEKLRILAKATTKEIHDENLLESIEEHKLNLLEEIGLIDAVVPKEKYRYSLNSVLRHLKNIY